MVRKRLNWNIDDVVFYKIIEYVCFGWLQRWSYIKYFHIINKIFISAYYSFSKISYIVNNITKLEDDAMSQDQIRKNIEWQQQQKYS